MSPTVLGPGYIEEREHRPEARNLLRRGTPRAESSETRRNLRAKQPRGNDDHSFCAIEGLPGWCPLRRLAIRNRGLDSAVSIFVPVGGQGTASRYEFPSMHRSKPGLGRVKIINAWRNSISSFRAYE